MQKKVLIFDVDGTLLDTFHNIRALKLAFAARYPERANDFSEAFYRNAFSSTAQKTLTEMGIPADERSEFLSFTSGFLTEEERRQPPFAGMVHLLAQLHVAGFRIGLNTSRVTPLLAEAMERLQPEVFRHVEQDLIVTRDLVAQQKPAPDSLLYLMAQSGLRPEELLFIGDSDADKLCAVAAGVPFAWAGWGLHIPPESRQPQDLCFDTPAELLKYFDLPADD